MASDVHGDALGATRGACGSAQGAVCHSSKKASWPRGRAVPHATGLGHKGGGAGGYIVCCGLQCVEGVGLDPERGFLASLRRGLPCPSPCYPLAPALPLGHRSRWTAIRDGVVRDNCYNHTETVDERLALFGVTPQLPLYVAADWADMDPTREEQVGSCRTAFGRTVLAGLLDLEPI